MNKISELIQALCPEGVEWKLCFKPDRMPLYPSDWGAGAVVCEGEDTRTSGSYTNYPGMGNQAPWSVYAIIAGKLKLK